MSRLSCRGYPRLRDVCEVSSRRRMGGGARCRSGWEMVCSLEVEGAVDGRWCGGVRSVRGGGLFLRLGRGWRWGGLVVRGLNVGQGDEKMEENMDQGREDREDWSLVFSFFLTGWVVWGLGYGWMGNVLIYGVFRGNGPEKDSIILP